MKVGLLNSRAARLSGYWSTFLKELGAEIQASALSDAEALALGQQSLSAEPLTVQLALGRILGLERVDTVLVPEWAAVSGDAWAQALTELLPRRISGLPALIAVPDSPAQAEAAANEVGFKLTRNAGRVRLALEKARPLLTAPKMQPPSLSRASQTTVAVVGPHALLAEDVLAGQLRPALEALDLYPVFSGELPLADVLQRAERLENAAKVPAGERELFGAASFLASKGAVRGVIFVGSKHDEATRSALQRTAQKIHKPALLLELSGQQTQWPELVTFGRQIAAQPAGDQL